MTEPVTIPTLIERLRQLSAGLSPHRHGYGCPLDGDVRTEACDHCGPLPGPDIYQLAADALQRLTQLREAVEKVVTTFERDEAAGYRSRDRQFAIEILRASLISSQGSQEKA